MKKIDVAPESPQYRIVEIFESLQDEGRNTDMPVVFVRLDKYSLACSWCDTNYLKFDTTGLFDVLGRLKTCAAHNIIITDGGSTIQPHLDMLLNALKAEGYSLCIEVNGLKPASLQIDYVATSSKACYATRYEINCTAEADGVRIVADGDVIAFCENMERKIRAHHHYLSPCEQNSVMNIYDTICQIGLLNGRPDVSVHRQLSMQAHEQAGVE